MSDRDITTGKFLPGNKASTGKNSGTAIAEYQEVFKTHITREEFAEIVITLKNMAKHRNIKAIELLFKYVIGLPIQRTELSGDNGSAINIIAVLDSIGRIYSDDERNR